MTHGTNTAVLALHRQLFELYPAEATQRLEDLPVEEIAAILRDLPVASTARVWERFSPEIGKEVLKHLDPPMAAEVLAQIDPSRGAALLRGLDIAARQRLLSHASETVAGELRKAIAYPPDSAGALMDPRTLYFHKEMTVHEALAKLRVQKRHGFRLIFIVDDDQQLEGMVEIQDLALADEDTKLFKLMRKIPAVVSELTTKEEIVEILDKYRLTDLPVVDYAGKFMGVVRYHALMDAAREETSADIQTMVGVSKDERALSGIGFAVRKRLLWLEINLATAFLAAAVVGLFEDTIARYTALAVFLPVVAGQSGNTGAQALAVTMRGLALREVRPRQWKRLVFKELGAGLINGIAVALTTSACILLFTDNSPGLALVLGISMVLSLIIAGFSGAVIPILLTVFRQDPAQASSIILTTVTDVMGFFSFLGIATLLAFML
jgi:magnesium transporter